MVSLITGNVYASFDSKNEDWFNIDAASTSRLRSNSHFDSCYSFPGASQFLSLWRERRWSASSEKWRPKLWVGADIDSVPLLWPVSQFTVCKYGVLTFGNSVILDGHRSGVFLNDSYLQGQPGHIWTLWDWAVWKFAQYAQLAWSWHWRETRSTG